MLNCSFEKVLFWMPGKHFFWQSRPSANQITMKSEEIAGCSRRWSHLIKSDTLDEISGYPLISYSIHLLQDELPKSLDTECSNSSIKSQGPPLKIDSKRPGLARPVARWCVEIPSHLWRRVGEAQKKPKGSIKFLFFWWIEVILYAFGWLPLRIVYPQKSGGKNRAPGLPP